MADKNILNFLLFINQFDEEDLVDIGEELKNAGIDPVRSENLILQEIKKARVQLKIEKGKKIVERYKESVKKLLPGQSSVKSNFNELAVEFRKLDKNIHEDDIKQLNEEAEKLEILRKIMEDEGNG